MEISELRTGDAEAWDAYVYELDASTFYHQIGWRNVVREDVWAEVCVIWLRGGRTRGITRGSADVSDGAPRCLAGSWSLVLFAPYGGVCADGAGAWASACGGGGRVARVEVTKAEGVVRDFEREF